MSEPIDPEDAPNVQAMAYWDRVVADLEATAEEYEARGWETLQLHPGDVTPLTGEHGDRSGLDVLVPGDEYGTLESMLADGVSFDSYRVFKAANDGMVFLLVAMEDGDDETAVLFPAYYRPADPKAETMLETAHREGRLRSYVRRLDGEFVQLNHDRPELFAPPEEAGEGEEEGEGSDVAESSGEE